MVKISQNVYKTWFMVDRSHKIFIFMNNLHLMKKTLFFFSFSIIKDLSACQPFTKFWRASKYSGDVKQI